MNIKYNITTLLIIFAALLKAQIPVNIETKKYTYQDSTGLNKVDPRDTVFSAIFIIDKTVNELYHTDKYLGETLPSEHSFMFKTYHRRIKLNNDEAVERFNTMYIPVGHPKELLDLKARSINPDGSITNFNNDNIKFVENYEESGPMKILALEGVQVGAEIEYIYTIQKYSEDFFGHIYLQNAYPKKQFSYQLIYPDRLEYKTKSYNGAPLMQVDSLIKDRISLCIPETSIEAYEEEESSAEDANIQRVEYMLYGNSATEKVNIYSWKKASDDYTRNTCSYSSDPKLAKKEQKAVKKIMKLLTLKENSSDKEIIHAVESYIKDKLIINSNGASLVHEVLKSKNISTFGAVRLYILLLEKYKVENQLVLTCNRFNKKFDGDFESYNYLEKFLLYFPSIDEFTDPAGMTFRVGMVPYNYSYTDGLFFKSKEIGGVKAYFPEIKHIKGVNSSQSYDNMFAKIEIDEDFEKCNVFLQKDLGGYSCSYVRPFLTYLSEDKKDELLKELLKVQEDTEVLDYKASNTEMKGSVLNHPLKIEGNIKLNHLIEKAGPQYLFKIGQIIGPQMEMYQEKKRKFDVESTYNRAYKRTLDFVIPEGYTIANLDALTMNITSSLEGKITMAFTSKYSLINNVLHVEVEEFYDEIIVPKARYEEYRAVINAAADFNKITLVLQKK